MPNVVVYATGSCPYCIRARGLLTKKGVSFQEIRVDQNPDQRAVMERKSGRTSVPQIFIDDYHVGGFDDLSELDQEGRLDELLGLSA